MREQSYATITHPYSLPNGFTRFDHPEVRPLQNGEPALGWDGDPRLAVYTDRVHHVLYRLEHDGEYRAVCAIEGKIGVETINRLICRLIEIDGRRGFDPLTQFAQEAAKRERDRASYQTAFIGDFADKLQYGLRWSHLPGVHIIRPKQAPTRG